MWWESVEAGIPSSDWISPTASGLQLHAETLAAEPLPVNDDSRTFEYLTSIALESFA
jgi:hypothetical protein